MYKIIKKEPFKRATIEEVEKIDLEYLQGQVDGIIQIVPLDLTNSTVDIVLNEEGKLIGLEGNILYSETDIIVGTVVICSSDDEGKSVGLTDEEIEETLKVLDKRDFAKRYKEYLESLG